jgi:3-methyladenine DNA glycosylase AlkD
MARAPARPPVADPAAAAAGLVRELEAMGSEAAREAMGRYGISVDHAFGVSVTRVRALAKPHRRDHRLAAELWSTGIHEARLLAVFVDDPAQVTPEQMDSWAADFDSWGITDQATTSLFDQTPHAWDKAREWSSADAEFIKRGAFALVAGLAVHDKNAPDEVFIAFMPIIERESGDGRNFVKKAVNWALRNVGKRDAALNGEALACARRILAGAGTRRDIAARAARWVANDALRELQSARIRARLGILSPDETGEGAGR